MMWLPLLKRFWPYLAGAVALLVIGWHIYHAGYEAGYTASESRWQAAFAAAEKARDAANARADLAETQSRQISLESERHVAEIQASLASRAADAERANRDSLRKLARASCRTVPETGGTPARPDATPSGDERADRAAAVVTDIGRRCESDARTLAELQEWVRKQQAIPSR